MNRFFRDHPAASGAKYMSCFKRERKFEQIKTLYPF